jgi:23S rRNA (pseudouridine1915-N3)-methyltransferase
MKIALLQTGKTTDKHIFELAELYISRIKKYSVFDVITLPELRNTKNMPVHEQTSREGKRLIHSLNTGDYVVILDERGKEVRTTEFSSWLGKTIMLPHKRLVFIIGGPWGFSEDVYQRGDFRLSLSKMTFPHQLVRLLFLEQMYRAFTIIRGEPYHHE